MDARAGTIAILLVTMASSQGQGIISFSINTTTEVDEHQTVKFSCKTQNSTQSALWIYTQDEDGRRTTIRNGTTDVLDFSILVRYNSSGNYFCSTEYTRAGTLTTDVRLVTLSVKSRPQHCGSSGNPEVAAVAPGDVVVRLCAFANPRPKLSAVSKGDKPSTSDLFLVNFKYSDKSRNRGDFIIVITNATEADLGNYTLLAFANSLESTLRFTLVSSAVSVEHTSQETTIILAVVLPSLVLAVVAATLVIVCKRRGKRSMKLGGVAMSSIDERPLQKNNRELDVPGLSERRSDGAAAAEADEIYECVEQRTTYPHDEAPTNNEGNQYSCLDQDSASNEQNEYIKFDYTSDGQIYNNTR